MPLNFRFRSSAIGVEVSYGYNKKKGKKKSKNTSSSSRPLKKLDVYVAIYENTSLKKQANAVLKELHAFNHAVPNKLNDELLHLAALPIALIFFNKSINKGMFFYYHAGKLVSRYGDWNQISQYEGKHPKESLYIGNYTSVLETVKLMITSSISEAKSHDIDGITAIYALLDLFDLLNCFSQSLAQNKKTNPIMHRIFHSNEMQYDNDMDSSETKDQQFDDSIDKNKENQEKWTTLIQKLSLANENKNNASSTAVKHTTIHDNKKTTDDSYYQNSQIGPQAPYSYQYTEESHEGCLPTHSDALDSSNKQINYPTSSSFHDDANQHDEGYHCSHDYLLALQLSEQLNGK